MKNFRRCQTHLNTGYTLTKEFEAFAFPFIQVKIQVNIVYR